ncbi:hypothetical protein Tco_1461844 [Tanacetum coccineum]
MTKKAHSQKLKDVRNRMTFSEDTEQETESASRNRKRKKRGGKQKVQKPPSPLRSRSVFSRLGSEEIRGRSRRSPSQASSRSASVFSRLGANRQEQRRRDARELIRSFVTCSSESQRENK